MKEQWFVCPKSLYSPGEAGTKGHLGVGTGTSVRKIRGYNNLNMEWADRGVNLPRPIGVDYKGST